MNIKVTEGIFSVERLLGQDHVFIMCTEESALLIDGLTGQVKQFHEFK